jgi:protein-S-isoprenylcysteine O-methyltransferase Ste14
MLGGGGGGELARDLASGAGLILLIAMRAVLEERTLTAELAGYADYAARVRYRLVPHLW